MSTPLTWAQLQEQYPLHQYYNASVYSCAEDVDSADDANMEEEHLSSSSDAMEWTPVYSVRSAIPDGTPQWSPASFETNAAASPSNPSSTPVNTPVSPPATPPATPQTPPA